MDFSYRLVRWPYTSIELSLESACNLCANIKQYNYNNVMGYSFIMKKYLTLVILAVTLNANAAIVDNGTYTTDTGTGLDWLDVTATLGLSYNQVVAELGAEGAYDGWRYATASEFDSLITNFGYMTVSTNCNYGVLFCDRNTSPEYDSDLIETIVHILGDTYDAHHDLTNSVYDVPSSGSGYTYGLLGENLMNTSGYHTQAVVHDGEWINRSSPGSSPNDSYRDYVETVRSGMEDTRSLGWSGSFLVRSSEVPLPAASFLFLTALISLAGIKYKM